MPKKSEANNLASPLSLSHIYLTKYKFLSQESFSRNRSPYVFSFLPSRI